MESPRLSLDDSFLKDLELFWVAMDDLENGRMDDEWEDKDKQVSQKLPCVQFLCPGHEC